MKTIKILLLLIVLILVAMSTRAEDTWQQKFSLAIDTNIENPLRQKILKDGIAVALEEEAPPCEVMRIAIGKEYKPYFVIKYIYESSKDAKIDELCWCATNDGIEDMIIMKAVMDSEVFRQNEIAKSDCLREALPYTVQSQSADPILPPPPPPPKPKSPYTPPKKPTPEDEYYRDLN